MNRSAARLSMPPVPEEFFLSGIRELVGVDRDWVPFSEGGSLYIRPVYFATEASIQVRPANAYRFVVVMCPAGAYFSGAVKLIVEQTYVRACQGGTGDVKPAGNYAGTLLASLRAQQQGYQNVIWLDAHERRFIEECGVMNIVFVVDDAVVTPPLSGTILPGVTRDTLLTLLREAGVPVEERPIALDELVRLHAQGRLREAAGVGTAATIAPIASITHGDVEMVLPAPPDSLLMRMRAAIHHIRTGRTRDTHGWVVVVP
jgi:branched-chain amino acid aminotransferase